MTSRTHFLKLNMHKWRNKRPSYPLLSLFGPLPIPVDGLPIRFSPTSNPYMLRDCHVPFTGTRGFFMDHPQKLF